MPDLLGVVDSQGNLVDTNPAWFSLLGYSPDEIRSKPFSHFIHPGDADRTQGAFDQLFQGEVVLDFVNRYRCKDGSYQWISWHAVPEDDVIFCAGRCVTEEIRDAAVSASRDRKSEALHRKNERALKIRDEQAALREQFIAVLGHDVRNPLAAINAAARVIGRGTEDAQTQEMLASIHGSTARIGRLIDDVMDFARARLGAGLHIDRTADYDVKPILEQVVGEISLAHPDTEIITEYDFCDPIKCDSGRIAQLISNLLANAVTHGAKGETVTLSAEDRDGSFYLWVTNRGTPIPDEVRGMLFEPFARSSVRQSQQGLGLGLFISREIARAHGGDLTMTSDASGTVFTFRMPRL